MIDQSSEAEAGSWNADQPTPQWVAKGGGQFADQIQILGQLRVLVRLLSPPMVTIRPGQGTIPTGDDCGRLASRVRSRVCRNRRGGQGRRFVCRFAASRVVWMTRAGWNPRRLGSSRRTACELGPGDGSRKNRLHWGEQRAVPAAQGSLITQMGALVGR